MTHKGAKMNRITIIGRLTKDLELKETNGIKYTKFDVAVNTRKDKADFFNCTAWREKAEILAKYLKKGNQVFIAGEMTSDTYTNQNGISTTKWSINVLDFEFLGGKNNTETESTQAEKPQPKVAKLEMIDDDLPF